MQRARTANRVLAWQLPLSYTAAIPCKWCKVAVLPTRAPISIGRNTVYLFKFVCFLQRLKCLVVSDLHMTPTDQCGASSIHEWRPHRRLVPRTHHLAFWPAETNKHDRKQQKANSVILLLHLHYCPSHWEDKLSRKSQLQRGWERICAFRYVHVRLIGALLETNWRNLVWLCFLRFIKI